MTTTKNMTKQMFAAIDDHNGCGAVYGIGRTEQEAIEAAVGNDAEGPGLVAVPITPAAAAYVGKHGGAPCRDLIVTRLVVYTISEEE